MERDGYTVIRSNERAKMLAGTAANLATGLIAAAAYRAFVERHADLTAVLWLSVSISLILIGYGVLGLLEPEN